MKFRFCGDLDCPDWVLAEIATLSKLTSIRMKILVSQIITYCINGNFNYEKVLKLANNDENNAISDLKGAIAAVHFICFNAAKHDVDELSLIQEIQQLGLPKENSEGIGRLYKDNKIEMREKFASESYSITKLISTEFRVDAIVASSNCNTLTTTAHLKFLLDTRPQDSDNNILTENANIDGYRIKELAFECSSDTIDLLLYELKKADKVLDNIEI